MKANYGPVGVDPFEVYIPAQKESRARRHFVAAGVALGAAMLLVLVAYSSSQQQPTAGGLAEKGLSAGASGGGGAPSQQLAAAPPAKKAAKEEEGGNIFASPFSTPSTGIFTGHRHGHAGGRLTFGDGTYHNVFNPNPNHADGCGAGHFMNGDNQCVECEMNKWCPGTNVVNDCPDDSSSQPGAKSVDQCICAAGTYGKAGKCHKCPAGSYCPGTGIGGKSGPIPCPPRSSSEEGQPVCRCKEGFFGEDFSACGACPANSYCPGGRKPVACPASTVSKGGAKKCSCAPSFFGMDHKCETCPRNSYCLGGSSMTPCAEGAVSKSGSDASADCTCGAGWYGKDGNSCEKCPKGSYCPGGNRKHTCPAHTSSDSRADSLDDCKCKPGFVGSDGAACNACPAGQWCPGGSTMVRCPGHSTSFKGSDSASDCYCRLGFIGADPESCRPCPRGSYCLGGSAVESCPSPTSSPRGSYKVQQCRCSGGYYQTSFSPPKCAKCPRNQYCPGGSNSQRRMSCPSNAVAPSGSNSADDCKCKAGYYARSGGCLACPAGSYCRGGSESPQACPYRSSAPSRSTSVSSCTCQAGTFQSGSGSSMRCNTCPKDYFCKGGSRSKCPGKFVAPAGASSSRHCRRPTVAHLRASGQSVPYCPKRDHDDADSVIFYQHCGQAVRFNQPDAKRVGDYEYALIDRSNPDDRRVGCQRHYHDLPAGWEIAPDNADVIRAIAAKPWGTHVVVVASGRAYGTSTYPPAGRAFNGGSTRWLSRSGSKYKPSLCHARVLMRKQAFGVNGGPGSVMYKGYPYAVLDKTKPDDPVAHCQRSYVALPSGWSIAPNDANSKAVIAAHPWGTHVVFVRDGTSYHASRYPPPGNTFRLHRQILKSGNSYRPPFCHARILIRKDGLNRGLEEVGGASLLARVSSALSSVFGAGSGEGGASELAQVADVPMETDRDAAGAPIVLPSAEEGGGVAQLQAAEEDHAAAGRKLLAAEGGTVYEGEQPTLTGAVPTEQAEEEELLAPSVPPAAGGEGGMMQMLAAKGWTSQLGKGDYGRIGAHSCDDDARLCQQKNCGLRARDMSSMDIPKGMTVTIYDQPNFRGRSATFSGPMDANKNCLASGKIHSGYFNDKVQSVKIRGPNVNV
eukprot:CAMPEP_0173393108 /NCGR_PEP_ID=MMETSP1356-20130122/21915_1 /TAXON_ID=77927 ORGANISM="Hemiselmis virescens, Strain PCC157" /NCGR_SAMPLE_ID=MMETSP1356 /ASSEMBLY_ACC=CAM_ASM_000847 /LENGTH=1129 /DNA_ID=CAMNT_0014351075 /DNA_START=21 /DNA_END=3410 /DNA_ORIENTATION=+